VRAVCRLLEALHYAHGRGFVHRDVKPGNLLLTETAGGERVKLVDFGLARVYQASRLSGLTLSGQIPGQGPLRPLRRRPGHAPVADQLLVRGAPAIVTAGGRESLGRLPPAC
jgi:serine/threonine protein kinase